MRKFLFIVLLFLVTGCQNANEGYSTKIEDFKVDQEITSIKVVDWKSGQFFTEITDLDFIKKLIDELTNADSHSTATMDFRSPDYKITFYSGEEAVYDLGYYREQMNLGIVGRYWDYQKDGLYGVTLELPIPPVFTLKEVETSIIEQGLTLEEANLPANNVFIQELNGISPTVYFIEGKTLSIYVFSSGTEREEGMKAFEKATEAASLEAHQIYIAKNVLVFYVEGDEVTNKKLGTAIEGLE